MKRRTSAGGHAAALHKERSHDQVRRAGEEKKILRIPVKCSFL